MTITITAVAVIMARIIGTVTVTTVDTMATAIIIAMTTTIIIVARIMEVSDTTMARREKRPRKSPEAIPFELAGATCCLNRGGANWSKPGRMELVSRRQCSIRLSAMAQTTLTSESQGTRTRPTKRRLAAAALAAAVVLAPNAVDSEPTGRGIQDLYGTYVGVSVSGPGEALTERDLDVTIRPDARDGFTVEWTAVLRQPDGKVARKPISVHFRPSKRPNVFASGMRNDMFGHHVPLDPLAGDPYLWAGLRNDTLTVHALHVTEDGGYEMQHHGRTLTKDGMRLRITRIRDDVRLKVVTGMLKKVSE